MLLTKYYLLQECSNATFSDGTGEGPFYLPTGIFRPDVVEDEPGLPVQLLVTVIGPDCTPVDGAFIDIWQANVDGIYSGFAGKFLQESFPRNWLFSSNESVSHDCAGKAPFVQKVVTMSLETIVSLTSSAPKLHL